MLDIKTEICEALLSDPEITSLLGGKRVYQIKAPDATAFPRITVWTVLAQKEDYFDNAPVREAHKIQIDIWSKEINTLEIANRVEEILSAMDYVVVDEGDLFEDDTKIFHKIIRVEVKKIIR